MSEAGKSRPKRGVSVFSYSELLGVSMTLEDCLEDISDMGGTCVEILASHVDGYPSPSPKWVDRWFELLDKYKLEPGEYGHWYDTRVYKDRYLTVDEGLEYLVRDFKIANLLGFKVLRTKLTTQNTNCDPVPGWEEYVGRALEWAEKYDVRMCTEVHRPTVLTTHHIDDYLAFIEKTGTERFGFNVDFGTFQNVFPKPGEPGATYRYELPSTFSRPEDILHVLPYTYCCHAKFNYMNEDFQETTIPYDDVLRLLVDNGYDGYLISEYEGPRKDEPEFVFDQLRRQHVMMKRILGY